jgi:hypothetical protein
VENGLIRSEIGDWQTFKNRILFLLFVLCWQCSGIAIVCGVKARRKK